MPGHSMKVETKDMLYRTFHEPVDHALDTAIIDFLLRCMCAKDLIECEVAMQWQDCDLLGYIVLARSW